MRAGALADAQHVAEVIVGGTKSRAFLLLPPFINAVQRWILVQHRVRNALELRLAPLEAKVVDLVERFFAPPLPCLATIHRPASPTVDRVYFDAAVEVGFRPEAGRLLEGRRGGWVCVAGDAPR